MSDVEQPTVKQHWEARYRAGRSWSGNVNAALEREISGVTPGTALDLGSGEGADALWLARRGWSVTAVDISPSALALGASEQGPDDDITWVEADLATWQPPGTYDLVSACFLHSEVELPREQILRRGAAAVAPGGLLLVVGHVRMPNGHGAHLPEPAEVLASLLDGEPQDAWAVETDALVERAWAHPGHEGETITDSVLVLRRLR